MSSTELHIPVYCGITGCWHEYTVTGYDEKHHPVKACCEEHKIAIIAFRHELYKPHAPVIWEDGNKFNALPYQDIM